MTILTIFLFKNKPKTKKKEEPSIKEITKKKEVKEEEEYKVDIKGEVNHPGIYSMKSGSRVMDVIETAGGLTENANTEVINLSKKITDEMVIIIYSNIEVINFARTKEIEERVQNNCIQSDENALKNDACINSETSSNKPQGKININTATKEELMTLTGIGESKANNIIKYRNEHQFKSIEELKEISGIGESIFAKIKENITV